MACNQVFNFFQNKSKAADGMNMFLLVSSAAEQKTFLRSKEIKNLCSGVNTNDKRSIFRQPFPSFPETTSTLHRICRLR